MKEDSVCGWRRREGEGGRVRHVNEREMNAGN